LGGTKVPLNLFCFKSNFFHIINIFFIFYGKKIPNCFGAKYFKEIRKISLIMVMMTGRKQNFHASAMIADLQAVFVEVY
jgi:hypothetical protein